MSLWTKRALPLWGYSPKGPTMRWPKSLCVLRQTHAQQRKCRSVVPKRIIKSCVVYSRNYSRVGRGAAVHRSNRLRWTLETASERVCPKSSKGGPNMAWQHEWELCLFVFVHVCKTSVGMFILKLKYVQVFTYRMLTIKYYILRVIVMRHDTFCTTFSLFWAEICSNKVPNQWKKKRKQN